MDMAIKLIWLGLLLLFAIGEAVSVGLTSIWFAAGALVALIAALLGGPLWLQIVLFIVVSALCLLAIRPLAQKHLGWRGCLQPARHLQCIKLLLGHRRKPHSVCRAQLPHPQAV